MKTYYAVIKFEFPERDCQAISDEIFDTSTRYIASVTHDVVVYSADAPSAKTCEALIDEMMPGNVVIS